MRKGFLFTFDALLATLVIIAGLVLISALVDHEEPASQLMSVGQDTMLALYSVKLHEINDPWIQELVVNGSVLDENVSVLEQIGFFWALGQNDDAERLAELFLNTTAPHVGLRLTIEGDTIYDRARNASNTRVASRLISGIAQGEAIEGSSASAYLKRVRDKRTNSFTVFGGFVGQGNISRRFLDLPSDANVTSITLELSADDDFTVAFNDVPCGGMYTPVATNGSPDSWDLSQCNTSLTPGATNKIQINFTGQLNESYITGGFLRVRYKTEVLSENVSDSFVQYIFPGIDGVVNLFDSFYVPGSLQNISVYLHYNVSNSTYLQIGDKRVWEDEGNGTERRITLNDSYLTDPLGGKLDLNFLSNKTVPLRFAGFAPNQTVVTSGDADVVLITDFSGSMKKAVASWEQGNLGSDCAGAYADDDIRRTKLATCVDELFVDSIMNYTGNRIWPVFLHSDAVNWYDNPEDASAIKGYINSYSNGKDKTCYACALNRAYEIFNTYSDASRKKFIVFMTDGTPTHCASGSCTSTSTFYGAQQCVGLCDTQGACDATDIPSQCSECVANPGGQTNAYFSANRSVQDFNATIFTVGFGPVTDCSMANDTLAEIAAIGNGTYQHSNDSNQLKLIYENISQEILTRTTLSSQVAILQGEASQSKLFDDSHINITFDLAEQYEQSQNTIAITFQTDQACNPVLELFAEQSVIEAKAVSYSGIHWTDNLTIGSTNVFNLSYFYKPYDELGDPTLVHTPLSTLATGNNTFIIETGDSPTNRSGCNQNNSVIATVLVNLSTERSVVVPISEGCHWQVQFVDDTFDNVTIPASYAGSNNCTYLQNNITYDAQDAYQLGTYQILERLDFRKEGRLFVNLREEDLEIVVTTISGVPYMWGPAVAKLEVMQ